MLKNKIVDHVTQWGRTMLYIDLHASDEITIIHTNLYLDDDIKSARHGILIRQHDVNIYEAIPPQIKTHSAQVTCEFHKYQQHFFFVTPWTMPGFVLHSLQPFRLAFRSSW
jgi:hypothetical protein